MTDQRILRPTLRARELRNNATEIEQLLWQQLKRRQLAGLKFSRQMPVGPYISDFMCRAARIVIEIDGSQHADRAEYDAARSIYIESQGFRVIRFWNNEVLENMEGVLERILEAAHAMPTPQPPPASGRGSR